jgi:peptide chain release factor 3
MKKVKDMKDRPLLLWANEWSIKMTQDRNKDLILEEFGKA